MWRRFVLFFMPPRSKISIPAPPNPRGNDESLRPFFLFLFFTNRFLRTDEKQGESLAARVLHCVCVNMIGEIDKRRSQGEYKVIALSLNLSADESSLEGRKEEIFAH